MDPPPFTPTTQTSHHHPPPAPAPPANLDIKAPIPISFSNGNSSSPPLKKHHAQPHLHHHNKQCVYRECLRNHAASLGGHALDGCGEFMPSPSSSPSLPSSLTCAACGCHRNFHRRLPSSPPSSTPSSSPSSSSSSSSSEDDYSYLQVPSAPHMLMALRSAAPPSIPPPPRKRFRTRFSPEQKERMQELSERIGWRLHKSDDKLVEDSCREIGVRKGVFKVWMHNNKHNFHPRSNGPAVTPPTNTSSPVPVQALPAANGNDDPHALPPVNGGGNS